MVATVAIRAARQSKDRFRRHPEGCQATAGKLLEVHGLAMIPLTVSGCQTGEGIADFAPHRVVAGADPDPNHRAQGTPRNPELGTEPPHDGAQNIRRETPPARVNHGDNSAAGKRDRETVGGSHRQSDEGLRRDHRVAGTDGVWHWWQRPVRPIDEAERTMDLARVQHWHRDSSRSPQLNGRAGCLLFRPGVRRCRGALGEQRHRLTQEHARNAVVAGLYPHGPMLHSPPGRTVQRIPPAQPAITVRRLSTPPRSGPTPVRSRA